MATAGDSLGTGVGAAVDGGGGGGGVDGAAAGVAAGVAGAGNVAATRGAGSTAVGVADGCGVWSEFGTCVHAAIESRQAARRVRRWESQVLEGFSSEPRVPLGARRPVALVEPLAVMTAALSEQLALSVVVPMYNEQGNVATLLERLAGILERLPGRPGYEIVVVNDGSTDATADAIRDEMRGVGTSCWSTLSRNFGHQLAATAGIELAGGDAVVLMDGDLQDPPELIGAFVEQMARGLRRGLRDAPHAQRRKPFQAVNRRDSSIARSAG